MLWAGQANFLPSKTMLQYSQAPISAEVMYYIRKKIREFVDNGIDSPDSISDICGLLRLIKTIR
jgi:hypothetical protein